MDALKNCVLGFTVYSLMNRNDSDEELSLYRWPQLHKTWCLVGAEIDSRLIFINY